MSVKIEIAVFSVSDALEAFHGGADRLELCSSILEGGITPSQGAVVYTKKHVSIPVFVMIRPRGGDFVYSETEFEVMKSDILFCRENEIDGVVFGILKDDLSVDKEKCTELVEMAKPMHTTFHRAFDRTADPFKSLEDIIACGFDRILTSGQRATAIEGKELIKELIFKSSGRITILPGSGIDENNLEILHSFLNANEYHSSAKEIKKQKAIQNEISMSSVSNGIANEWVVSGQKVNQLKKICEAF